VTHQELGEIALVNQAIKLSRTPAKLKTAIGALGADTDAVLAELGRTPDQIAALHQEGVV